MENYVKIDEESVIEIHYYNQVLNVFLRGKMYDKFFKDMDNDFMHILKTSDKKFVWDLIEQIENDRLTHKEELASDYGISLTFPKNMEVIKYDDYGMYDFTDQDVITIDGENKIYDNVSVIEAVVDKKRIQCLRRIDYDFFKKVNEKFLR